MGWERTGRSSSSGVGTECGPAREGEVGLAHGRCGRARPGAAVRSTRRRGIAAGPSSRASAGEVTAGKAAGPATVAGHRVRTPGELRLKHGFRRCLPSWLGAWAAPRRGPRQAPRELGLAGTPREPALAIAAPSGYTESVAGSGSGLCRGATRQEYGGNMTAGHAGAALGGGTPPFPLHLRECSMPRKTLGVATAGSKGAKPPFRQATGRPANGRAGRRSSNCSADPLKLAVSGAFPPCSATRGAVRLGGHDLAAPREAAAGALSAAAARAVSGLRGRGLPRRQRDSAGSATARRRPRAHRACPPWLSAPDPLPGAL